MDTPFHRVNVLTGVKSAIILESASEYAALIRQAKRPLLVLGPKLLKDSLGGRLLLEWALEIAGAADLPICATAHVKGGLAPLGVNPDSEYDAVEIINHLKDPEWPGVKRQGNHDLVIFFGFRTDFGNQGLSVLKHFAPHLKTMTLCKYVYPNADYALPNLRKDEDWQKFLEDLLSCLKERD
jgi:anaerobic carbon-monoxide dehydrogenase, CODH/ACS complex subunit epsilon